ncbi:hypothetical protein SS1G_12094 [Sclerotinia sclerotiorum 1980 UF-70]|uniref:Uncharacterized protein n=1 Tax=Sclerotinia sclerotiorum (strain ATCC 18683 / 1980 / Ss-1) TaxID=665079 RepID=A7F2E7_SCLS1|nr:hypothetical protein SS1G_12094 [Sclerotinia sclerotiorum 1980 UF-70]EDN95889.1 hypothetical protein SS1G_12094 [Sclerotinia sclerotiorum 1980 UF-70]
MFVLVNLNEIIVAVNFGIFTHRSPVANTRSYHSSSPASIRVGEGAVKLIAMASIQDPLFYVKMIVLTLGIIDRTPKVGSRLKHYKMMELEEKSLFQYIIDIDERGFSPRINDMEDMANYTLETQGAKKIGKL